MERNTADRIGEKKVDKVGYTLFTAHIIFLVAAVGIIVKILWLQQFYHPSDLVTKICTPDSWEEVIEPERGSIYACDGRLLAMSIPEYQLYMDCTVMKEENMGVTTRDKDGRTPEEAWLFKARQLSEGLAEIFGDMSAAQYYELITSSRKNGKGYVKIGHRVGYADYQRLKQLPLFNEGKNRGGLLEPKVFDSRQYPYGSLAQRTIGYVADNRQGAKNNSIGIEGKFNYALHGKDGRRTKKMGDKNMVQDLGAKYLKAVDGMDIRTTLDIDIQDIADGALRDNMEGDLRIDWGSVIIMEVKTGAIRAMVNLDRSVKTLKVSEQYNHAVGTAMEMGSVIKTTTLTSLLEDDKAKLSTMIPTDGGVIPKISKDSHIPQYERQTGMSEISVVRGFEKSSNYVFQRLALDSYQKYDKLVDKLYLYKLGETYDFDLEGFARPQMPDVKHLDKKSFANVAIGYNGAYTPLHVVTFYNAIANRGRMMKPYLVESIEQDGRIVEKRGPSVLAGSICSRRTADSVAVALRSVVLNGTGYRLRKAKWPVAGKTGTAFQVLDSTERMVNTLQQVVIQRKKGNAYMDINDKQKKQASFVGFFPADNPQYTAIVTMRTYHGIGYGQVDGSEEPAQTFRDIVDRMYALQKKQYK